MRQSPNSKMQLFFMLSLTLLLLLQLGMALLHHHHEGSYYDHKDQFHHVTIETPCPGKVTVTAASKTESNAPAPLVGAVIPHQAPLEPPAIFVPLSPPTPVRHQLESRAASSSRDRAPPA